MKMEKILNSGLGMVLVVLAVLVAGRTVSILSWQLWRVCKYAVLGGILVLALGYFRKNN